MFQHCLAQVETQGRDPQASLLAEECVLVYHVPSSHDEDSPHGWPLLQQRELEHIQPRLVERLRDNGFGCIPLTANAVAVAWDPPVWD